MSTRQAEEGFLPPEGDGATSNLQDGAQVASPGHEQVLLTPEVIPIAADTTNPDYTTGSQDNTPAFQDLNPARVDAIKAAICSPRKSGGTGQRHADGNISRVYVGRIATEYKEQGKLTGKTGSGSTFLLPTLKDLYKPEVLSDKKGKERLRDMVYKAHKAYENGNFLQARAAGTLTTSFGKQSFVIRSAEEIATGLHDWYLRTPAPLPSSSSATDTLGWLGVPWSN